MKYYHAHSIIALVAMLVTVPIIESLGAWFGGCLVGITIYISREVRDLEKLHNWRMRGMDWEGLLWPLISTPIIALIITLFK